MADIGMLQPEQGQPAAVGGHQAAATEAQDALARGAQQGGVMVQPQQLAVGQARVEVAVLDVRHRLPRQHPRMQVLQARITGDVQHAHALAIGVEDRRGRAGQDAVRGEVVLAAAHLHRAPFDDRGTDGIGAHGGFIPAHARHQRHAPGLVEEARAAFGIEDPAVFVGEQHDAAGGGDVGGQAVQLGPRQPPQLLPALAQFAQARIRQRLHLRLRIHRQAAAQAALPGLQDGVGHHADRRGAALEERTTRIADTLQERLLGHLFLQCRILRQL